MRSILAVVMFVLAGCATPAEDADGASGNEVPGPDGGSYAAGPVEDANSSQAYGTPTTTMKELWLPASAGLLVVALAVIFVELRVGPPENLTEVTVEIRHEGALDETGLADPAFDLYADDKWVGTSSGPKEDNIHRMNASAEQWPKGPLSLSYWPDDVSVHINSKAHVYTTTWVGGPSDPKFTAIE